MVPGGGRSRISIGTHSLSATAIDSVHIENDEGKPVRLRIVMSNSAGVFQLRELFREKLSGSGLEPCVEGRGAD